MISSATSNISTHSQVLAVRNLNLGFRTGIALVHNVNLDVGRGQIVGIVGESGSGKTLTGKSILGLLPSGIRQISGEIHFEGQRICSLGEAERRSYRGGKIGYIFQDPMTSLNPSMRIGDQLDESLWLNSSKTPLQRRTAILEILERIGIKEPVAAHKAYPHQFSGGMRQRIMIASVMLMQPKLIIADEPTTALDAIVQRGVMELLIALANERDTAMVLVSHDLPMVAHYCERIYVMKDGHVVEAGVTGQIFDHPTQEYTRKLLDAIPYRPSRAEIHTKPLVRVEGLHVEYGGQSGPFGRRQQKSVLHDLNLEVRHGEVVAIVGQSGSGKTTLGKAVAGLLPASQGRIEFDGRTIEAGRPWLLQDRRNCQFIFQDPHSSLDPRMTVRDLLSEPLRRDKLLAPELNKRIYATLTEVGLKAELISRYPHQLSGGQKQRVAIARAIIGRPAFIVADEVVSALDVTVRAQVLALFSELQQKYGFSCIFVSHDLAAVEQVSDRVIVMFEGRIVEEGSVAEVFDSPRHEYTRRLLSSLPTLRRSKDGVELGWRNVG